ncbi:MAG: glycosyltransferase family 4 protein, partial [Micrococcales bacterium]|nr:glycosyltransferase family 4 protein [Micrococcales bacterium]
HHTYAQRLDFIVHRVAGLRSDLEESSSASAHGIDTGWSLGDIVAEGERIVAAIHDRSPVTEVAPETFPHGSFEASGAGKAVLSRHPEGLLMSFRGPPSQAWHIGFGGSVPVSQVLGTGQVVFLSFDAQIRGQGHVGVRVSWMDDDGQRVPGKTYFETGCTHRIPVPGNAARIRLFLTVKGEGIALLTSIKLAGAPVDPLPILVGRKTRTLLVTDYYPTYDLPYQRGFVHSRVKSYAAYGAPVDVWVTSREPGIAHREYDTVDVMSGRHAELHEVLRSGAYDTVLVHTMYAPLWKVLKEHLDDVRIVAWMHGAELHRYWLDPENPTMDEAREVQIEQIKADPRFAHWREVLADPHPNLRFVVVSQTFLDQMNEDLAVMGVGFPADQTVIIHNPVSPDRFPYRPKPVEQRKRLMSLRPFWTRKYANDLTVAAIVELSSEPWFGDLEILVAGDGKDFDEIVAPLVGFGNVTLENRFFTQPEIAALHREYGVALVPTRADSQGVSRDEAMSSGLVPITTAVDAIPEFVSKDEGYVVPGEDAHAIADAVRDLYHHPEVFARKSAAAAARIRRTVADDVIIPQEIGQFHDSP